MSFLSQVELRISGLSQVFSAFSQFESQIFRAVYVVRACSYLGRSFPCCARGGLKSLCDLNPRRQRHSISRRPSRRDAPSVLVPFSGDEKLLHQVVDLQTNLK